MSEPMRGAYEKGLPGKHWKSDKVMLPGSYNCWWCFRAWEEGMEDQECSLNPRTEDYEGPVIDV